MTFLCSHCDRRQLVFRDGTTPGALCGFCGVSLTFWPPPRHNGYIGIDYTGREILVYPSGMEAGRSLSRT